jgi:hypothetical protein
MSIEGIIVGILIAGALLLWAGMPFLTGSRRQQQIFGAVDRQRERLQIYYQRVLRNIHDLDEDFATGKLNPDEYHAEREVWAQRGVIVLKAMDELDAQHLVGAVELDDATLDEHIEATIEARVRAVRQQAQTSS